MALTKAEFRRRWAELRALVAEWDPLGLLGLGAPADEYDCLINPLMRLLDDGVTAEQVSAFLLREFSGHFGVDFPPDDAERVRFAERARAWLLTHQQGPAR